MVSKVQYRKIVSSFPGVIEKPSHGDPCFFVVKKFFSRLRDEDDLIVLRVASVDERDMLLEADPATFTITDHYRSGPWILAHLAKIGAKPLRAMLEQEWRRLAPKSLQKEVSSPASRLR